MSNYKVCTKEKISIASLLVALGIIYGDIGTSPLYVLKAVVGKDTIDEILVLGGVSCVFWTLTFQTTFKYIYITLKADNQGEGGIFSLYALVRRYGKYLAIPAMIGATALLADGIITPPISIASAVEGLRIIDGLEDLPTVSIVIVILSILFFMQRFGTHRVGRIFGPIMFTWFSLLFIMGVLQIIKYPSVLKAVNPYYAYELLTQHQSGFWLLGAVFLATTGAEALYSDLGHCGRKNIRITWVFVKICLLCSYFGQAAWILHQGSATLDGRNPFFGMMPPWFLPIGILIATLAAIVASQALISGSFTLISEAMNLNFWPRVALRQPSETKGQIYIPSINNLLWVGCIGMILYFRTSEHMEAAYGFSITVAMLVTTFLLSYFLIYRLKWNKIWVFSIVTLFFLIEISFFVANAAKIKERWRFLFFELFIFLAMYVWNSARKIKNRFTKFVPIDQYKELIKELSEDDNIPKFCTHLIYLTKANFSDEIEEKIVSSIFDKKPKRADVYWLLHINRTEEPYTLSYDVEELLDDKLIKVNINIGFRLQPRTELYFKKIVQDLVANKELSLHIRPDGSTKYNPNPDFKFVVIEKFLSVENEFSLREGLLLNSYFILKNWGQSDEKAFGLDKNDVVVEQIPMILHPVDGINLVRASHHK